MHFLSFESTLDSLKSTFNVLFVQIKSGWILDILWAFLIKQLLFHSRLLDMRWLSPTRLVGYLSSHIQRALVE